MPISVTCPGCNARFTVSDKFAGKQGPCPKCKAKINIPKLEEAPKPAEEVKIHAPEEYSSGPKGATGRPVTKPISRRETRLRLVPSLIAIGAVIATFVVAWVARTQFEQLFWLRAAGLLVAGPSIVVAGYWFLRNDELEPYRSRWLWVRAAICAVLYAGLWGIYYVLPDELMQEPWSWMYIWPPFVLAGGGASFATLDLDFGSALTHYGFFLLVTLGLGYAAGLDMPWASMAGLTG